MKDTKLGELIDQSNERYRDAIHIAIAPVIAGEELHPGAHIGFTDADKNEAGYCKKPIGVVDPFLSKKVKKGEEFWMLLHPQTITSLRHEWTHPAFQTNHPKERKAESEEWIHKFAHSVGLSYHALMAGAEAYIDSADYLSYGELLYNKRVPDEFWDHYEKITGKRGSGSFFSCSC